MEIPQIPLGVTPQEYESQIRQSLSSYKKVTASELKKAGSLEQILGAFDETPNSGVEYLLKLHDCCNHFGTKEALADGRLSIPLDSLLFTKIAQYMGVFDPVAVRYVGVEWRHLVEVLFVSAVQHRMHAAAVSPIRTALQRIDPTGGTFTSLHLSFLRIVMMSGILEGALPIIDRLVHSFPSHAGHAFDGDLLCSDHLDSSAYITLKTGLTRKISDKDVQEYYLLAGMICIGVGRTRWEDAMMYLEMVITSPTQNTATGFMLEAYRKWLLLGCLVNGQNPHSPKSTNSQALKTIKSASKPYEALVKAFTEAQKTGNSSVLRNEVTAGLQVWEMDGNRGLATTLADSIPRFYIKDLSKRFTSVPISQIASYPHVNAPPENTLQYIRQLIDGGELQAEIIISKAINEPVLHFTQSNITNRSEPEIHTLIVSEVETVKTLASLVRLADAKLMISKDFIGITRRNREEQHAHNLILDKDPEATMVDVGNTWTTNRGTGFNEPNVIMDDLDEDIMDDEDM